MSVWQRTEAAISKMSTWTPEIARNHHKCKINTLLSASQRKLIFFSWIKNVFESRILCAQDPFLLCHSCLEMWIVKPTISNILQEFCFSIHTYNTSLSFFFRNKQIMLCSNVVYSWPYVSRLLFPKMPYHNIDIKKAPKIANFPKELCRLKNSFLYLTGAVCDRLGLRIVLLCEVAIDGQFATSRWGTHAAPCEVKQPPHL